MKKHSKTTNVQITNPAIERYAEQVTTSESEEVVQLIKSSDEELEYIDMLSGKIVGQLLKQLVSLSGAKRILEIGTFTGYSALMMAEALPDDGELITIEMNFRYQKIAQDHFAHSAQKNKISLIKDNAKTVIQEIEGPFDLVYLDGDKLSYSFYYHHILPKIPIGGLLIADNVLWDGMVLDPKDPKSKAIHEFNEMVSNDHRVEQVLLPIRDGVNVIRKISSS